MIDLVARDLPIACTLLEAERHQRRVHLLDRVTDGIRHSGRRWRSGFRCLLLIALSSVWCGVNRADAILARDGTAPPGEVYPIWRMRPAHVITKTPPRVPKRAEAQGVYEATVFLVAKIDANGRPHILEVLHCTQPGYGFERAAIAAAKKWRYEPALLNGKPVEGGDVIKMEFERPSGE